LPIGIQIVRPYLEDRTSIAFAELIEREFGEFVPPPDCGADRTAPRMRATLIAETMKKDKQSCQSKASLTAFD
jgi:hypothetical protein